MYMYEMIVQSCTCMNDVHMSYMLICICDTYHIELHGICQYSAIQANQVSNPKQG